MLAKTQIVAAFDLCKKNWQNNEDDSRSIPEYVADFVYEIIESETKELISALTHTNQLLSLLLNDPLVQKDQKNYIRAILQTNQSIIKKESEVINA